MVSQDLGKTIVLFLCILQVRDVIEQQLSQRIGSQVQKFLTRSVQQHFFESFDLTCYMNVGHFFLLVMK